MEMLILGGTAWLGREVAGDHLLIARANQFRVAPGPGPDPARVAGPDGVGSR
jgi:hypothetical protein